MSNGVGGPTVMATPESGPMTFTARTGLAAFPVRVVSQESLTCEDASGLHQFAGVFDSPYETGGSSSITVQPSPCPTGQTAVFHQVTAQAQETYQYYVFGEGFRTATVTTGAVDFSFVFPQ